MTFYRKHFSGYNNIFLTSEMTLLALVLAFLYSTFILLSGIVSTQHYINTDSEFNPSEPTEQIGRFSFNYYYNVAQIKHNNILVSPTSLNYALTAVLLGTNRSTYLELGNALGLQHVLPGTIVWAYGLFATYLQNDQQIKFDTRLVVDKYINVNNETTPFADFQILKMDLVGHSTVFRNFISQFLGVTMGQAQNYIYKAGGENSAALFVKSKVVINWQHIFNLNHNIKETFFGERQEYFSADFMYAPGTQKYYYKEDDKFNVQILELPLSLESKNTLLILLPKERNGIKELENQLKTAFGNGKESFLSAFELFKEENVEIHLPTFRNYTFIDFGLKQKLHKMGIKEIFTPFADFSRMSNTRFFIKEVIQKTELIISKESISSNNNMKKNGVIQQNRKIFKADHPFIYIIKCGYTGIPVFIGRFSEP